jgi:hypothetical protein
MKLLGEVSHPDAFVALHKLQYGMVSFIRAGGLLHHGCLHLRFKVFSIISQIQQIATGFTNFQQLRGARKSVADRNSPNISSENFSAIRESW